MSFSDAFTDQNDDFDFKTINVKQSSAETEVGLLEGTIEDVRKAKIKVKSELPTPFGVVYEFFTKDDTKSANKILNGKIKDKTILVTD